MENGLGFSNPKNIGLDPSLTRGPNRNSLSSSQDSKRERERERAREGGKESLAQSQFPPHQQALISTSNSCYTRRECPNIG